MTNVFGFRVSVAGWWLSVGVWLGAMIMLAIAAAAIFRTVRAFEPTIGIVGYEELASSSAADGGSRHADIIAGAAVGRTLRALAVLQAVCAIAAITCLIVQSAWFSQHLTGGAWGWPNVLRMILVALPAAILVVDLCVVSPRVWRLRERMFDSAASAEQRSDARAEFQQAHRLDETLYKASTLLLAGAMIVSAIALQPADRVSFDGDARGPQFVKRADRAGAHEAVVQAAIDDR